MRTHLILLPPLSFRPAAALGQQAGQQRPHSRNADGPNGVQKIGGQEYASQMALHTVAGDLMGFNPFPDATRLKLDLKHYLHNSKLFL